MMIDNSLQRKKINSEELEQGIIHILLTENVKPSSIDLLENDFSTHTNKTIWACANQLESKGEAIDIVSIGEEQEKMTGQHNMRYMAEILEKGYTSLRSLKTYVNALKSKSKRRQAKEIAFNLQMQIDEPTIENPVEIAIKSLMELERSKIEHNKHINTALTKALKSVEAAFNSEGVIGIPSGINDIDRDTGGFKDSDLIVIGARPAMGKTALMLNFMKGAMDHGAGSQVISSEQNDEQVASRLISMAGSVSSVRMRNGDMQEDDWPKLSAAISVYRDKPVWINDESGINISSVKRQIRESFFNKKIKIAFVDYIQKIKGSNPRASKTDQVTEVVSELKNLAKELRIPIVALCQVKRAVEERNDKRPQMGDLSDASEIEKEADMIFTLYRDEVYNDQPNDKGIAELLLCKNRHGPTCMFRVAFIGKYFQFRDLSRSDYGGSK